MKQTPQNSSQGNNRERNSYVIRRITQALLILLEKKPIREISVSELCSLAETGRVSFYRNFESKEDILKGYIRRIFREWTDAYQQNSQKPLHEQIRSVFGHFENHREFYRLLSKQNLTYLLKDVLTGIFGLNTEQSQIEAYSRAFVAYTLYGWIDVWFQRGMKESAEELASLFQTCGL